MNISRFGPRTRTLAAAFVACSLIGGPSAAAAAHRPTRAGQYEMLTSQHRAAQLVIGPHGHFDFDFDELVLHCQSGLLRQTPVQTDPTDHFRIGQEGHFWVDEPFINPDPSGPRGAHQAAVAFQLFGRVGTSGRIGGTVRVIEVFLASDGRKVDVCRTRGVSFHGHRLHPGPTPA